MRHNYYVYILANRSRTLYVGVTKNQVRRLAQHRDGSPSSFTRRYAGYRVVHVEWTSDINAAIAREKQIKRWSRAKKIALIESENPGWHDLSNGWTR